MIKLKPMLVGCIAIFGIALAGCGSDDSAALDLTVVKSVVACSALATVDLSPIGGAGSKITSAVEGDLAVDGVNVKFCTVEGTLASAVGFRVRLPVDTYAQRILHMGCGGLCGSISAATVPGTAFGCPLVQSGGFVLSSSDMGHSNANPADANWTQDAQRRVDFAYRGVHVTTEAAKRLTLAYYGQAHKRSYFVGCSDGGREGLMAAQRYPTDYDGIVVGAPAFLFNIQNSILHGWSARSNRDNGLVATGNIVLKPSKMPVLRTAVMKACDALDGQSDNVLTDPRICNFDPATIQCAAGASDTTACLTAAEVSVAKRIYAGPNDAATGRRLVAGGSQFGSELTWPGVQVPNTETATGVGAQNFVNGARSLIFADTAPPTLDEFQFNEGFLAKLRVRHALNDATNPDLSAFKAAGGKIILYHGWEDQHISPINTIAYREAVERTMGATNMDAFMRTYLIPGLGHCSGGNGANNLDLVTAMVNWSERNMAADTISTARTDSTGAVTARRPLYPFPNVAKYNGQGDPTLEASYSRSGALFTGTTPDWVGADFFLPYLPTP